MTCASSICNSLEFSVAADRRVSAVEEEDRSGLSSSSTSSIGKNSDESSVGGGEGEEVESEYKEGALDSLDALEEVLPVDQLLMMNPLPTVGQAFAMISQEESHTGIFSVPSQQLETSTVFYDVSIVTGKFILSRIATNWLVILLVIDCTNHNKEVQITVLVKKCRREERHIKFYCGKSKSFTSLSDAEFYSSMKDITKPENAYSRKRKNLMAYKNFWDKNSNNNVRNSHGGISKRPNNSRSMLALEALSNCSESNNGETSNSTSSSPGCSLPPLPPTARRSICNKLPSSPPADKFSSWRSFSLSDLQGAAAESSSRGTLGLWTRSRGE